MCIVKRTVLAYDNGIIEREENYYEYFKNWKQSPPYIYVSVSGELLLVEDIDYFHDLGLQVGVWTINNSGFAEMYAEAGVDYITSDFYII